MKTSCCRRLPASVLSFYRAAMVVTFDDVFVYVCNDEDGGACMCLQGNVQSFPFFGVAYTILVLLCQGKIRRGKPPLLLVKTLRLSDNIRSQASFGFLNCIVLGADVPVVLNQSISNV